MRDSTIIPRQRPSSAEMVMNEATRQYIDDLERTIADQQALIDDLKGGLLSLAEDMRQSMRQ